MTDFEKNTWTCPVCGQENSTNFCTACGTPRPITETAAEPVKAAVNEPVKEEITPQEPAKAPEPVRTEQKEEKPAPKAASVPQPAKAAKTKKSHPILTALLAGLLGLCGGYGGAVLAMRNIGPVTLLPETEQAAAAPAEETAQEPSAAPQETAPSPIPASVSAVSIQDVAESASKTVVEIQTENTVTSFGLFGGTYTSQAAGSGVIFTEDGYIITNNHVVEDSQKITVKTYSGEEYEAKLIGTDAKTDIAVIKIEASGLEAAEIGNSDELRVGDTAIVIGNPLGTLGGTVTNGIISATNRDMVINNQSMNLIQTNAAINSGNSGGGLFDGNGKLIGIVNAKDSGMTSSGTVIEGLGFAIPINTAYEIATELKENGYVTTRPTIGVGLSTLDSDYGVYKAGLYITQVYEGSGAEEAGLKEYDRIISVNGTEVNTYTDLSKLLTECKVGDEIEMEIEREGEHSTVTVKLTGPLESMMS